MTITESCFCCFGWDCPPLVEGSGSAVKEGENEEEEGECVSGLPSGKGESGERGRKGGREGRGMEGETITSSGGNTQ